MKKIVIYYIATGKYISFFYEFLNHIKYFKPNYLKEIVVLTDSNENLSEKYSNIENLTISQHYIQHFVWPIVALFKMKYIFDFWHEGDFSFYFNANLFVNKNFQPDLNDNEIYLASHYFWNYRNSYTSYNTNQIKESSSYIDYNNLPHDIVYCQSAFFGGSSNNMKKICEDVTNMLKKDLLKNIIPTWHDESYLNKWYYDRIINNKDKNIKIFDLCEIGKLIDKNIAKCEV